MKKVIKKIPLSLSGVILGFAALGNLLQSYGESVRYVCGMAAAFLLLLLILKLVMFPKLIKEDMQNPIMASVSATFPMALMLLSTYIKPFISTGAKIIWFFAICLHIALIVYFTVKFILKIQFQKVFASYFIVYVGIAAAAVTAPVFEELKVGVFAFWFGLITLFFLLILVTMRYIKYKNIPESAKPLFLYLCSADKSLYRRIYSICYTKIKGFFIGYVICGNSILCFGTYKSNWLFKIKFLSNLCGIYIPICNQCNRNETDNGLSCKYETTASHSSIHCFN